MKDGVIRRIAAICRHRKPGFNGNAMCLWRIAPDELARAGAALASCSSISHCCERIPSQETPYNLYAMLHAKDAESVKELFRSLSAQLGQREGKMLLTKAELKKTSPAYY